MPTTRVYLPSKSLATLRAFVIVYVPEAVLPYFQKLKLIFIVAVGTLNHLIHLSLISSINSTGFSPYLSWDV